MENATVEHALRNSRIKIHSFSIWGIPPTAIVTKGVVTKPQLLYSYPSDANLPSHLAEFMVPFECKTTSITNKNLIKKEYPYFQLLHTTTHSLFCTCLPHSEVVPFPSDVICESEIRKLYSITNSSVLTTRVYCLATSAPIMTTSVQIIQKLLDEDFYSKKQWLEMYYLKTVPIERSYKYITNQTTAKERVRSVINEFNAQLREEEHQDNGSSSFDSFESTSPFPVDSPLLEPTQLFKSTSALSSETSQLQKLKLKFSSQLQSIRRFCYPRLLTTVSAPSFISMVNSVLTGKGCVVVSQSPHQLSIACFALLSMIEPFSWQGLFIPIVPPHLCDFLESPLPAILGTFPPKHTYTITSEVVYLGKPPVFKKINSQQHPIILPNAEKMILKIAYLVQSKLGSVACLKTFEEREEKLESLDQNVIDDFVNEIQTLIQTNCIDQPLQQIKNSMEKSKQTTIDNFITQFLEENKDNLYLEELVQTQHFNSWWYETHTPEE